MSQNNRKAKSSRRRTRRKKQSKLFAAVVIELIAAVALFGAYQFAKDTRASQQSSQTQTVDEQFQPAHVQTTALWNKIVTAVAPPQASSQANVFHPSRLIRFMPKGS